MRLPLGARSRTNIGSRRNFRSAGTLGTVEEVLEVCNHVPGTVPVLNMAHIHARGHGRLKTSEDYAELFDQAREPSEEDLLHSLAGVEHRMGNAQHYTQIKKSISSSSHSQNTLLRKAIGWISQSSLTHHC